MFATLAGGYSREPLPAQPARLADADRALASGEINAAAFDEVADSVVREVVSELETAGLAILTDGGVRWPDRYRPIVAGLAGLEVGDPGSLPTGEAVTRPRVVDGIGRARPVFVDAWRTAAAASDLPVKQVVPGPYTLGRLAELGGRSREAVTIALAEALAGELADLAAAGCPIVQVDEELATTIGQDPAEWRLFARAHEALMRRLPGAYVHLSLGLCGGAVAPAGHDAVLSLPYLSYVVDVLAGPDAWRFVAAVPAERGILCGAADARRKEQDEVEPMVWAMAWAAEGERGSDRVGIAPNGSLGGLDRLAAKRKVERLGETVRIASMGPLRDLAEALDPEPLASKMADLRRLAEAVEAARGG